MRELKKALVLGMCFLSLCTVALANTENEMNMRTNANEMMGNVTTSMAVVLKKSDFEKEASTKEDENEKNSRNDTLQMSEISPSQKGSKTSVTEVIRQTDMIGTAENPTIEGGLMSAPELQASSEEKDFILDARTALIFAKLNDILNRSPAYNAKALLTVGQKVRKTTWKNLKTQTRLVFRFWMKKALMEANASIKPKQKNSHKTRTKALKSSHDGVKNASH